MSSKLRTTDLPSPLDPISTLGPSFPASNRIPFVFVNRVKEFAVGSLVASLLRPVPHG
ncbi:hypothetical protein BgiMline_021027, partial [Biomphalaria glabrata]